MAYQWRRKTAANNIFSDIVGATQFNYVLTDDDVGFVLGLKVLYRDGRGYESTLISEATPVISVYEPEPEEPPTDPGETDSTTTINDISLGTIKGSATAGGAIISYSGLLQNANSFDGLRFSLD